MVFEDRKFIHIEAPDIGYQSYRVCEQIHEVVIRSLA